MKPTACSVFLLCLALACYGSGPTHADAAGASKQFFRHAEQLEKDGNHADAHAVYEKLLLATDTASPYLERSLLRASDCLRRLNRGNETDALREKTMVLHGGNWRFLEAAARDVFGDQHHGFKIAGAFKRGHHRGGGEYMGCYERDRVQALQWLHRAGDLLAQDPDRTPSEESGLFLFLAEVLTGQRSGNMAWRLQSLTDLETLPPFQAGRWGHQQPAQGAPVDRDGKVMLYGIPGSYTDARSDGERWRWTLQRAATANPSVAPRTDQIYAQFLHQQFGVQTMVQISHYLRRPYDGADDRQSRLSLPSLRDDETLARLATGIQRFTLPPEHHFIARFKALAYGDHGGVSHQALNQLARIFENRRQYERAADTWRESIAQHGDGSDKWKQKRLDQIIGNWGQFEPGQMQPDGADPMLEYRFRNGAELSLTARRIKVAKLLRDVQAYIQSDPRSLEWRKLQIENIGYRLVTENQDQYVGEIAALWREQLDPAPGHYDRRIRFSAPVIAPGAYLVTGEMKDGNTSHIIVWVSNTVLLKKTMQDRTLLFAANARSGEPLPGLNVECFGYRRNYHRGKSGKARTEMETTHFAAFSNSDGMVIADGEEMGAAYQWMIIASSEDRDRFAHLGFTRVWHPGPDRQVYNRTKAFIMTDRPVYRPGQPIHLKTWLQQASYEPGHDASFAGREITLRIKDPQGTTLYNGDHTTDAFGGVALDWTPPADARLGVYRVEVKRYGSSTFRLEEYKKPEFEVTVNGPAKSIRLGDTIAFTIKGAYYFGAPVAKGTVRYKVKRRAYRDFWYPIEPWDWLYGNGYGWLGDDWTWFPGWQRWGYPRPQPLWFPRPEPPPELVAEGEAPLTADGTLTVRIDTATDAELYGDIDQRYEISAEITDASRRTITGSGSATATRAPFRVCIWPDRGFYQVGDTVRVEGSARTIDGTPVPGQASIRLLHIRYDGSTPTETTVQNWSLEADTEGRFTLQMEADQPGQYRVSCMFTDRQGNTIEGAQILTIRGEGSGDFQFDTLQLAVERSTYAPGEKAELLIGTSDPDQTVLLFERPVNGSYSLPRILRMDGHTAVRQLSIRAADRPNIFVEALTVRDGKIRTVVRELLVPPDERVLTVEATPSAEDYKPGEPARIELSVRDGNDQPVVGACVVSVYDKALDTIAGGGNVPDIRVFFWKWRRNHSAQHDTNIDRRFHNLVPPKTISMMPIGVFGHTIADDTGTSGAAQTLRRAKGGPVMMDAMAAPMAMAADSVAEIKSRAAPGEGGAETVQPAIRKAFADTAYWNGMITTDSNGMAEVAFDMPENLTAWRIRTWALGNGARVGEASSEVTTSKNLLLRLQAPRFFVEQDEVVLSANIHNYLSDTKQVQAVLELDGPSLQPMPGVPLKQWVTIGPGAETRADWRVKVMREGEAVVRMLALSDEESDAMEMRFPVYVHGMLKTDSFSRVIRPDERSCRIDFTVPAKRRPEASRLEVRTSPSLAATLVDALPYLADYPYGCTEQTLNRFLPTLVVRQTLRELGIDLGTIKEQRALHRERRGKVGPYGKQPYPAADNPVFDTAEVERMVREGIKRLVAMQVSDGGWGWFSGWGERSSPHTTAVVVQGLQEANRHGAAVPASVLERGRDWLLNYQSEQRRRLDNAPDRIKPWKRHADNLDALVFTVLAEAGLARRSPQGEDGQGEDGMRGYLYRDRNHLSVYSKALLGLAMHQLGLTEERDMLLRNVEQYRVDDTENQTTYLELGNGGYWWCWYGQDSETHAAYLRLLNAVDPKSDRAAGLVKYLLNNRKHGAYWDSTRDTAYCIEAMAEYLLASGERSPEMTVTLSLDQQTLQSETITPDTLFSRDDAFVLSGNAVTSGDHELKAVKTGEGPLYVNAALTMFTLEDMIRASGLELKIDRKLYRLHHQPLQAQAPGAHGQPVDQARESFFREAITHATTLDSGDLVEIELTVTSKNDYEYIVIEDHKAAGMEPVAVRSGYTRKGLRAYVEYRDERVVFFIQSLMRGSHSLSYRVRAEIPGTFSALPARAFGMYAPELTANSDEVRIRIND